MPTFKCDSPVCSSSFSASSKEALTAMIAEHVRTAHDIPAPTQSIMDYLTKTSVKD